MRLISPLTFDIMNTNNQNRMIKNRGIDALVNECLIGPVLTMGATFIAYACALLAYLYLPHLRVAHLQQRWHLHAGCCGFCVLDWPSDLQHLHNSDRFRHRYHIRGMGSGSACERPPGPLRANGSSVSACAAVYPCVERIRVNRGYVASFG